jgi:hypothetical protein
MQSISPINSALLLSFDNKNLKTNEMITGKTLNREKETPPTPRHKNPVNNLPITDRSFKITEKKAFWNGKAHSPAKRKLLPHRSNPLFIFYMCLHIGKETLGPPNLESSLCFLKIENGYND